MTPWLQIFSSPQRLILQESYSAYRVFDDLGDEAPCVIQVIGGENRSRDIAAPRTLKPTPSDAISLHSFPGPKRPILLVDSGAALRFKTVRAPLDQHGRPGCYTIQGLIPGSSIFPAAVSMFSRLIAGLCQTVVIFMDDNMGLSGVQELLASWIRLRQYDIRSKPRLILVSRAFSDSTSEDFKQRMWRYMLRVQQMADPTQLYKHQDIEKMFWDSFESLHLLPTSRQVSAYVLSQADAMFSRRHASRWAFSAIHLRRIFHDALVHYSTAMSGNFDFVCALRKSSFKPENLAHHIGCLLRMTSKQNNDLLSYFIASALHMNAYPAGGHGQYFQTEGEPC